jgi:hypothetical protein
MTGPERVVHPYSVTSAITSRVAALCRAKYAPLVLSVSSPTRLPGLKKFIPAISVSSATV